MNEQFFENGPTTTLASAITSTSSTSATVTSSSGFPATGDFQTRIDDEIITVSAVSGTTWTIARGQENTTAAVHANGSIINMPLTAQGLERINSWSHNGTLESVSRRLNFVDSGTVTFTVTDQPLSNSTDVTADASGGGGGGGSDGQHSNTAPDAASTFTWVNQGSATATDDAGGLYLLAPAVSGNNGRLLVKSLPGSTYTIIVRALVMDFNGSSHVQGICLRESSSGKFIRFGFNAGFLLLDRLNSPTSYDGNYTSKNCAGVFNHATWLKAQDDGTNLIFSVSIDGYNWFQLYSVSHTAFITVDQYGLYAESNDSTDSAQIKYVSIQATSP